MTKKWTIGLADDGHTYLTTALFMEETQNWSVMLKVDGVFLKTLPSDDPAALCLILIADAQIDHDVIAEEAQV